MEKLEEILMNLSLIALPFLILFIVGGVLFS